MPRPAGEYTTKLRWLVPTTTTNPTTGEPEEVHATNPAQAYLWAAVEEDGGRRGDDLGATQTGVDVTIRLRNYPAVDVSHLLEDRYQGWVYHLETITYGDDETRVQGYRNDHLEDHEITED